MTEPLLPPSVLPGERLRAAAIAATVGLASAALAYLPEYTGLGDPARHALFILLLAAGLWVTEAVPAFAVGLVVVALEIALLGNPAGEFAAGDRRRWETFVSPWGSPVMWLFLGGLVLASAAHRTGIDRRGAALVLRHVGRDARFLLLGTMTVAFVFSMWMSNTATTAMVLSVLGPLVSGDDVDPEVARAVVLGVPVAANVGGMSTVISSPPNVIAAGALAGTTPIDFARWMLFGAPPALVLAALAWWWLQRRHALAGRPVPHLRTLVSGAESRREVVERRLVLGVLAVTVLLWVTESVHGIPTAVIAVFPVAIFAMAGILGTAEVRALPWDVLLLIFGGLALGVAVSDTGLAAWIVDRVRPEGVGTIGLALALAVVGMLLSQVVSNTAAANILIPIAVALVPGAEAEVVLPLALAASSGICLPASTPPNAIAFATGRVQARDFLGIGLVIGLTTPILAVLWTQVAARIAFGG